MLRNFRFIGFESLLIVERNERSKEATINDGSCKSEKSRKNFVKMLESDDEKTESK